jgi:ribonuclease HI
VVWKVTNEWCYCKFHPGDNKEVYDAELYAIAEALWKAIDNHVWTHIGDKKTARVFTDSIAALTRIQDDSMELGQSIVRRLAKFQRALYRRNWNIEYHWVPGQKGTEGNEQANKAAKEGATSPVLRGVKKIPREESFTSLAHLHRKTKDTKPKKQRNA